MLFVSNHFTHHPRRENSTYITYSKQACVCVDGMVFDSVLWLWLYYNEVIMIECDLYYDDVIMIEREINSDGVIGSCFCWVHEYRCWWFVLELLFSQAGQCLHPVQVRVYNLEILRMTHTQNLLCKNHNTHHRYLESSQFCAVLIKLYQMNWFRVIWFWMGELNCPVWLILSK